MRIICNTNALTDACLNVQRCIPSKAVLPHLECILIKTLSESKIEMSGYDLELGITTSLGVRVERGGSVVLNAKTLCDILRHIPSDTVSIDCDEKNVCTVKSGDTEYTLISLNPDEYPEMPELKESVPFNISQTVLRDMVKQTIFAVSTDDTKAAHRGIKFEITAGQIKLIALDGFRLAIRTEFADYNGDKMSFVVPAKTMNEVIKLIGEDDSFIKLSIGRRHIIFETGDYVIISRLLEGEFLDYHSAVPTLTTTVIRVGTKELIDVIERTSIIITEKTRSPIRFIVDNGIIKVSAVTALGSASDRIEASVSGKRLEIGFNNRFFLDALRSCDTDEVLINLNGPVSPAVILPPEGSDFLYLVLPVRIKND
mgnify:FL=1